MGDFYRIHLEDAQTNTEREARAGRRYKLHWTNEDGTEVELKRLESPEQLHFLMSQPEYAKDEVFRASVADLVAASKGVPGVWSNDPAPNKGNVDFVDAARKEALRAHAAKMHEQLGSADPIKKWEALQFVMNPENAEAVRQAQEVYGGPGTPLQDAMRADKGNNAFQHETGSVEGTFVSDRVSVGPSDAEQAALIQELSQKGRVS